MKISYALLNLDGILVMLTSLPICRCKTMALLGPSGSGKTAMVYAVAQELGFMVLEVNPSMERSPAQVREFTGIKGDDCDLHI
jgi:ABC-type dipeptide/oligopeptide/nickel transport system ATPase subunit